MTHDDDLIRRGDATKHLRDIVDNWSCGCDARYCRCSEARENWSMAADEIADLPAVTAPQESPGDMLNRLGMDGAKWAAEFRATALRLGYSDMDEGWLIGWFANAIMAGYDRKPAPATPEVRALVDRIRKAWPIVRDAEGSGGTLCAAIDEIDAALAAMEGK